MNFLTAYAEHLKIHEKILLKEIDENEEKIFIAVSHLVDEIDCRYRNLQQQNEEFDPFTSALQDHYLTKLFHFLKIGRNETRPNKNSLEKEFKNPLLLEDNIERHKTKPNLDEFKPNSLIDIRLFNQYYIEFPHEKLDELRNKGSVEIDEFGAFAEEGIESKGKLTWFPFAKCKVSIEDLQIKSTSISDKILPSEKVSTRSGADELTAWNFHHWFLINLLWNETEPKEINYAQAWNQCLEFTAPQWVQHPISSNSWFFFTTDRLEPDDKTDSLIYVLWMQKKDENVIEENLDRVKLLDSSMKQNADFFALRKATFKKYFNEQKKKKSKGSPPPKKF